jgi:hypothetical protein
MTGLLAKACITPMIESMRNTCFDLQYIIADPAYYHTITINGGYITCSCGASLCSHIQVVRFRQARNAEGRDHHAAYRELFDLGYGD